MRIVSWNVNGLRSVVRNGFIEWLKKESPDILCLQEIKIQKQQIPFDLVYLHDYYAFFSTSTKKGYSGVAVYSKVSPKRVNKKLGLPRFDDEGRLLEMEFADFILMNLYVPHGARDKRDLDYKLDVYKHLFKLIDKRKCKNLILAGDFNIAHEEIDLARPRQNKNNIMFTYDERKQIDKLLSLGFIDSFRKYNSDGGNYTWFSYRRNAKQKGLGWRIDYIFISENKKSDLKNALILSDIQMGSDHCPVEILI